ncbi:MAG: hypothetical protein JWO84_437 [Parcubacteria group bacterium]|nr:hypothetical protein [Parcubacteria group bacterium]
MLRDLNDIIPPSRRRSMEGGMEGPQAPTPAGQPIDMRPAAPAPVSPPPPHEAPLQPVPPMSKPPRRRFRSGSRFPFATALIALVVIAACAGVLYAFAGAKVTITPVTNLATIQSDMTATAGQGDLPFQQITVDKTMSTNVPAESTVTAADPASGKITITNTQTAPQALIKNTRFQSANGLIFRIRDSVSIPAGGSLVATVYADEAGDKYNLAPTTFTIPGLKGSKSFDQVSAKSVAAMTGGFSGSRPSVSQATKDKQYADIQAKLAADLAKDLTAKMPAGYVLVPGASFTSYSPGTDAAGASGTVTLSETGNITAVVFPADALARAIAFKSVGTYGGQPVTLKDVSGLALKPTLPTLAPDAQTFDFNLAGNTTIVWQIDPAKIAAAVAGKTRASAEIALKSFPEVDKGTLLLRPFWASNFPGDPAKIKVILTNVPASK